MKDQVKAGRKKANILQGAPPYLSEAELEAFIEWAETARPKSAKCLAALSQGARAARELLAVRRAASQILKLDLGPNAIYGKLGNGKGGPGCCDGMMTLRGYIHDGACDAPSSPWPPEATKAEAAGRKKRRRPALSSFTRKSLTRRNKT